MSQVRSVTPPVALSSDEIFAEIVRLAAEQGGVEVQSVTAQSHFQNDLGYDSLDRVEFMLSLEERFDIAIADEEAESIHTVGAAFEKVRAVLAPRG